jgi:outer membrane protein TolC
MRSNNTSRECTSWCKYRKSLLILLFVGWTTTGYAQSDPAVLTLKEVLNSVHRQGLDADIREEKNRTLLNRYQQRDESRIQHTIVGRSGISKNEVGDSLDLEASARESTYFTLSYEQQFESGFNWTASQTLRSGRTLTGDEDREDYRKQMLVARVPVYGRGATLGESINRKTDIELQQTAQKLSREVRSLELEVARTFLEVWQSQETLRYRQQIIGLLQNKHNRVARYPNRSVAIEIELLDLEVEREREYQFDQQATLEQAQLELLGYLARQAPVDLSLPPFPPAIGWSEEIALKAYQEGSPVLAEMESRAAMLAQDIELAQWSMAPEVQVGGFIGNTQVNGVQGNNFGLNVTVTYHFGGGERPAAAAMKSERAALDLEIQKEKERIKLQYQADRSRYDTRVRKAALEQKELALMQKKLTLTRLRFEHGDADLEEVAEIELSIARKQLEILQARVDCWERFLALISGSSQLLSDLL